jgi:hypothetical protein
MELPFILPVALNCVRILVSLPCCQHGHPLLAKASSWTASSTVHAALRMCCHSRNQFSCRSVKYSDATATVKLLMLAQEIAKCSRTL